jgi:hypothetical protein
MFMPPERILTSKADLTKAFHSGTGSGVDGAKRSKDAPKSEQIDGRITEQTPIPRVGSDCDAVRR